MELKSLNFSFQDSPARLFENLNLKIIQNQINVFLGPSGCGKSTLLRIFAGLLPVGAEVLQNAQSDKSFVFQEPILLPWLSVHKNILLPLELKHQKINQPKFDEIVKTLGIEDCLKRYPHQISGGQKMRASIARALITNPKVLFMDEPFSALDEPTRMKLQDELVGLQKSLNMTILFVTHSYYEAAYLGQRVTVLSKDRPVKIVSDLILNRTFNSRYDSSYLSEVQKIADCFERASN